MISPTKPDQLLAPNLPQDAESLDRCTPEEAANSPMGRIEAQEPEQTGGRATAASDNNPRSATIGTSVVNLLTLKPLRVAVNNAIATMRAHGSEARSTTNGSSERKGIPGLKPLLYMGLGAGIYSIAANASAVGSGLATAGKAIGDAFVTAGTAIGSFATTAAGIATFGSLGLSVLAGAGYAMFNRQNDKIALLNMLQAAPMMAMAANLTERPNDDNNIANLTKNDLKKIGFSDSKIDKLLKFNFAEKTGDDSYTLNTGLDIANAKKSAERMRLIGGGLFIAATTGAGVINGALFGGPIGGALGGTIGLAASGLIVNNKVLSSSNAAQQMSHEHLKQKYSSQAMPIQETGVQQPQEQAPPISDDNDRPIDVAIAANDSEQQQANKQEQAEGLEEEPNLRDPLDDFKNGLN